MRHSLFCLATVLLPALCSCASSGGYEGPPSTEGAGPGLGTAASMDFTDASAAQVSPVEDATAAPPIAQGVPDGGASGDVVWGDDASGDESSGDDASGDALLDDAVSNGAASPGADSGLGDACLSPQVVALPESGDLLVTEVMFDPSGEVPQSQWFEVYNLAVVPELLSGLTILDGYSNAHVIASQPPVVAPPGAYVLLVRDRGTADAAGVPDSAIVYEYGTGLAPDEGIQLAADATGDLSLWNESSEIVDVPYGSWGMASPGQSIELASLQSTAEGQPANWCIAQSPWASGADDGTPGAPNDCP